MRLRQYYPGQEVINEKNNPVLAEPPQYKEKQTILPHPISHDEAKKTPCKRTYEGKAKKSETKKLIDMEDRSRHSSESGTDDSTNVPKDDLDDDNKKQANKDEPKIDMRKMVIEHNMINQVVAAAIVASPQKVEKPKAKKTNSTEGVHKEKKGKRKHKDEDNADVGKKTNKETPKKSKSAIASDIKTTDCPATTATAAATESSLTTPQLPLVTTQTTHLTNKVKLPEPIVPALPMPLVPPTPFTHREAYVNSLNQKEPEIKIQVQIVSDQPLHPPTPTVAVVASPPKIMQIPTQLHAIKPAPLTEIISMETNTSPSLKVANPQNHIITSVEEALTPTTIVEDVLLTQPQLVVDHEEEVTVSDVIETVTLSATAAAPPTLPVTHPTVTVLTSPSSGYTPIAALPPLPPLPPPTLPNVLTPLPPPLPQPLNTSNPKNIVMQIKTTKVSTTSLTTPTKSHKTGLKTSNKQTLKSSTDLLSSIMASMDNKTINTATTSSGHTTSLTTTTTAAAATAAPTATTSASAIMGFTTTPTSMH